LSNFDTEQEISVKIPGDDPVIVKIDEALEDRTTEKKVDEPDEREVALTDLRKQLDEQKANAQRERQAREQAEKLAREREEEAKTAKSEVQDSNLRVILNAIDAAEQGATNAERDIADAIASGDTGAATKAYRALAQSEAQLLQLKNGKAALEERLASRTTEGRVDDTRQPTSPVASPGDPVEALAARLTPKSAAWLREHPTAAGQVNKLTAAHQAAVELEGIPVESPEYFSYIEQRLGMAEKPATTATKPRNQSLASAPVSSSSSSGSSRGGNTMTLSPAEVEFAILNEPGLSRDKALETYARAKAQLIKEGKLS
jgi:hypothetical protein